MSENASRPRTPEEMVEAIQAAVELANPPQQGGRRVAGPCADLGTSGLPKPLADAQAYTAQVSA